MSRKTVRYTEGEVGEVRVVQDFLPPPDMLALRARTLGTTIGEVIGSLVWIVPILIVGGVIAWAVIRWLG